MDGLVERIGQLERQLVQRDNHIRLLRAELDKCQQVLNKQQPQQQQQQQQSVVEETMAQIAPWRLEPKLKRLAISAEPLAISRQMGNATLAELKQSLHQPKTQPKPKS